MSYVSIGDMAQTYMIRRQNSDLKATAATLATELSTGQTSDISKRFSGDYSVVSSIETSLTSLGTYKSAANEAGQFASAMQLTLENFQDRTTTAMSSLLLTGNSASKTQIESTATDVRVQFDAAVTSLNTQVGGRSLFAGIATDGPAMASPDVIIEDLKLAIAGATTAADVEAAVDTWFDTPGGGYDTVAYLGSDTPLTPFQIGLGEQADISITAADSEIRDTLKGLALAALISEGALSGDVSEQALLLQSAGESLLTAGDNQTIMRASLGSAEAHIENVVTQTTTEIAALEIVRTELLAVDPYAAASELEAVQTQLETLYALTARMSRLSLVDYL